MDNVEVQRAHNVIHKDGTPISFAEEAKEYMKEFAHLIKEWEGAQSDPSLLDAGCRWGYCLPVYMEWFPAARVVGLDIVPEFVEFSSRETECVVGDISALPFKDQEFDYTFCCQTLEHAPDTQTAAKELLRVTRKALYISVPLEGEGRFEGNPSHSFHTEDPMDWLTLFRAPEWVLWKVEWAKGPTYLNFILRRVHKHEFQG